ncbi:MAG: hypothetical protein ACREF5_00735 [Candidatus Saccharimonadales bacterium]
MRKQINIIIIWIALVIYSLGLSSSVAFAASSPAQGANPTDNGQALEIGPPLIYLNVNPGQTVNAQIDIRDISSGDLIVSGQVNDFVAAGESGTPKILLYNDTNDPYTLKNWISPLPNLLLSPEQIKTLTVTLNVPTNASPGGHYGVVRFTATPPSLKGNGVSLSASLGVLLLVTVSGKITNQLSVNQFSVNDGGNSGSFFESGPLNFVEKFKNTGNVQEQPVGQVSIFDMFNKKLASVNVNLPPGNILPQSIRKFEEPLNSAVIGNKALFGRYTANLKVIYGPSKQVLTSHITFWVIPYLLIGALIIVLIGGFFVLRYAIRRYNRYILSQGNKSSSK